MIDVLKNLVLVSLFTLATSLTVLAQVLIVIALSQIHLRALLPVQALHQVTVLPIMVQGLMIVVQVCFPNTKQKDIMLITFL